ncbi:endonuclease [Sungkyunkwania multivorans]|uniref:Endonuclease n=1 Tax=Sungkyunkwania multivorans TaxID=1173618 RepID=A0ABW3CUV5_9FLAO
MKRTLLWCFLLASFLGYAQIPSYYNDVNLNLSGTQLKDELAVKVITTHTNNLSYTPGVWDALKQTDLNPANSSQVLLIYGWNDSDSDITNDRTRGVNDNGGGTGVWNREHVYAKSLANPDLGTSGPGADAHNLRPCDAQRNSSRSNRRFADGSGNSGITPQGYWYPGDEWKGDVARMMMYMYLRYDNQCYPSGVGTGATVANDPNMLQLFLQWNAEDPVSQVEEQRNPVLEGLQGNRNPFIDNPAFATQIWGGPQAEDKFGSGGGGDTEAPTIPNGLSIASTTASSISLNWNPSSDNVAVTGYDIYLNGSYTGSSTTTDYTESGLMAGTTYNFAVLAKDAAGNASVLSNTIAATTNSSGGGSGSATELFFSEYVEGSSYNKALEIANFTGTAVNLSNYSIKKQTNGSGSWSAPFGLAGTLTNSAVYVVAHSSASATVTAKADVTTTASIITFNGNDAVGLFKNDVLIDILGTFNGGSANYAQDVTLRRNSSTTSPNTVYSVSEWDSFAANTFDGLGTHALDGGTPTTVVLNEAYFETGWDGWIDGGGDAYRYNGSRSYEGSYSIRIRDDSSTASSMTSPTYDISGFDQIEATFYFYAYSMENGEDFWFRYHNGSSWQTVASYARGADFDNNTFYSAIVIMDKADYSFVSNGRFRFQCDASANADQIYIDQVTIKGITGASSGRTPMMDNKKHGLDLIGYLDTQDTMTEQFMVYPNPVVGGRLYVDFYGEKVGAFKIYNLLGQTVNQGSLSIDAVDVGDLNNGVYILEVNDGDEIETIKFVKR